MQLSQWLQKQDFENQILSSSSPRIVLFAADWCGYCKRFFSIVNDYRPTEGIGKENDVVALVNIDSGDGSLWDEQQVDLVPTIVVFEGGREVFRRGARPFSGLTKQDLDEAINCVKNLSEK